MFVMPIQDANLKASFLLIGFYVIWNADKFRTAAIGIIDIPFRSHLKRKKGSSDMYDAGVPEEVIMTLAS